MKITTPFSASLALILISLTTGCATVPLPSTTSAPELADEAAAEYAALDAADALPLQPEAVDDGTVPIDVFMPLMPDNATSVATEPLSSTADEATAANDAQPIFVDAVADDTATAAATTPPNNSIWPRLVSGFALPDYDHPKVKPDLQWYAKHQKYLNRTFERAAPYLHYIVENVEQRGIPMEIALLPVVESAFQPFAYSHGRAAGLWQFIPGTARMYGMRIDWWYDGRRDVIAATEGALTYLDDLQAQFDGDWLLALAAYNSGAGTVRRAIRNNKKAGKGTSYWDLKLPRETRGYVPKLLAISGLVKDPDGHGVTLPEIENTPRLAQVEINSQLDLALAAEMADMTMEEFYLLNPGFNRWATSPDTAHTLLLPIESVDRFRENFAQLPKENRVQWVRHKVGEGETLGHIAKKYRITVQNIQRINNLRGHLIRAGHHLLIPVASRDASNYTLSQEQRLTKTQNTPKGEKKIVHNVQPGDTLWELSMAHNISVRRIAAWNNMAPGDYLRPGQELVIWTSGPQAGSASIPMPPASIALPSATRKINYRVRQGDSLARIAQRFNVTVNDLLKWNPTAQGKKYIQPGQMLIVYVDVTRAAESG